jgi:hypothetical protein
MNVLDYTDDTNSWNSEGNHPQDNHLTIDFKRAVLPRRICIQFQAGFAAEICTVHDNRGHTVAAIEPEDIHEVQSFPIMATSDDHAVVVHSLKLVFTDCTDFYDRLIVYRLEVWGLEASPTSSS